MLLNKNQREEEHGNESMVKQRAEDGGRKLANMRTGDEQRRTKPCSTQNAFRLVSLFGTHGKMDGKMDGAIFVPGQHCST